MYKIIKAMITLLALSIIIPIKLLGLIIKAITRAIKQAEKNTKYAYNIVNVLQSKMNRHRNVLNETDIISIRRALKPEMQAEIEHKAELQRQREIEQEERQAKAAAIKQKISAYIKKQATAIKNMFNNDHEKSD